MSKKLREGRDFYFNQQGLMVLTAAYLRQRGYCCGSGCLHCPYEEHGLPKKLDTNDENDQDGEFNVAAT